MQKPTALVIVGSVAIVSVAGLIMTGYGDIANIGVVCTFAAQVLNLINTAKVSVKVNGNLSKLIEAKTIPDLSGPLGQGVTIRHEITAHRMEVKSHGDNTL